MTKVVEKLVCADSPQALVAGGGGDLCPLLLEVDEGIQLWDEQGRRLYFNPATMVQFGAHVETEAGSFSDLAAACLNVDGRPLAIEDFPVARVLSSGLPCHDVLVRLSDNRTLWPICSPIIYRVWSGHSNSNWWKRRRSRILLPCAASWKRIRNWGCALRSMILVRDIPRWCISSGCGSGGSRER